MSQAVRHVLTLLLLLTVILTGCGSQPSATTGSTTAPAAPEATTAGAATPAANAPTAAPSGETVTLKVGASPVPHAEILRYVQDNLAANAGLNIEVIEFTDYVQPNLALQDGQLDANFFQHVPYMEDFAKEHSIDLVAVAPVHIEPLGLYSKKVKAIAEIPNDGIIAIPNDATNAGRALQLLAANGLLTLKEGLGASATVNDITANPKNLQITELEAAQLPRSLDDTSASIINGNYALEIGLTPNKDALVLESAANNPYANVLAILKGKESDPNIEKLATLLESPEVKKFIEDKYQGVVIPAS